MFKRLINELIKKIGRQNYQIDFNLSHYDLFILLLNKFREILRGFAIKIFLGESKGLLFIGESVRIKHKHLLFLDKNCTLGDYVQINALSKSGIHIGRNTTILNNSIIDCTGVIRNLGEGLIIGQNVGIAQNCFIQVRGKVVIEKNVIIGPNVSIFSENHIYDNPHIPISQQGEVRKGVLIEEGTWIGTRATILDGVTIGNNSIVAAGSLVNKDVPPFSIVAGVPAKVLKYR